MLVGAVIALPGSGQAAAPDPAVAPQEGVFALEGHGYGHGRGMSQWGAQGAAVQGVTYPKILSTYYPGTALVSSSATKWIRVLITDDTDTDMRVRPAAGLTVLANKKTKRLPTKLAGATVTAWRVHVVPGRLQLEGFSGAGPGGRWRVYKIGGKTALTSPVKLKTSAGGVRLVLPDGEQRDYRGEAWAYSDPAATSGLRVVNNVNLESYLRSVVPSESFPTWRPAALQAQAVAARTYALWRGRNVPRFYADICDTTACQVYHGRQRLDAVGKVTRVWEFASTDAAIGATAGKWLAYGNVYALTEFSASNGGWSTDGQKPYLPAREDPWDGYVPNSAHAWTASVPTAKVEQRWPQVGTVTALQVTSRDGNGDWGGRVLTVQIIGTTSTITVSGATFAGAVNLKHVWWRGVPPVDDGGLLPDPPPTDHPPAAAGATPTETGSPPVG
jgi:stage II sporulation protein D